MTTATYQTISDYSVIQTFYADPEIVSKSGKIALTSVELFFKTKPSTTKNASGKPAPGVTVAVCEVINDQPVLENTYYRSTTRKSYDDIYSFSDASTGTVFSFPTPLKLNTGKFYGIVVIFEDPGFELWTNKQGDKLVGTNTPSPGSNIVKDGKMFLKNNSGVYKAISDTDLKFSVSVAQYVSNTYSEVFVNKSYEFFNVSNRSAASFIGGEWVYGATANATGNVSTTAGSSNIVGIGTTFTSYGAGDRIIVHHDGRPYTYRIDSITNNTLMSVGGVVPYSNSVTKFAVPPMGRVYYRDDVTNKLFLVDSTANTTNKFVAATTLTGVDSLATANLASIFAFSIDRLYLKGDTATPAQANISNIMTSARYSGGTYAFDTTNAFNIDVNHNKVKNVNGFDAHIQSRSQEVDNVSLYSNAELNILSKSLRIETTLSMASGNNNLFQAPSIDSAMNMFVIQNKISNTYTITDANSVVCDSEVYGSGIALSRHIGSKVTFANNRFAEDIKVYMNAYRPAGTELRVYARIHNSADPDAFDDRQWTLLEYTDNELKYSSSQDEFDIIEYELGLPSYGPSANVLPGSFTTQLSNTVIVASSDPSTYVAVNNVVKLYNPLIPTDYIIAVVAAANSTTITLGSAIANNNLVGSGFQVDRLKYYNTAFNNVTNDNVARYYNSSVVEFDTFDSMQIKIVMLSDSTYVAPKVDFYNVIGVSA